MVPWQAQEVPEGAEIPFALVLYVWEEILTFALRVRPAN